MIQQARHGLTAESGSSSYGLSVRLRLLPTPPRDDAVAFGYMSYDTPWRGLAPRRQNVLTDALAAIADRWGRGRRPRLQQQRSGPIAARRQSVVNAMM